MYVGTNVLSPNGTIRVAVLVDGQEQPLYRRPGDGKVFVVGLPGQIYTLQVHNLTGNRVEVINTVDGRHTLKDESGDPQANRGLVFNAHHAGEFTGWRINDQETREFVFGTPEQSIAAQATGSTANVGVIGFAVHRERMTHAFRGGADLLGDGPVYRGGGEPMRGAPASFGNGDIATRGGSLGTGMGALRQDRVGSTQFARNGSAPEILVIGYDVEEVLRSRGILAPAEANAFPGIGTGYAQYATTADA